MVGAGVAQDGEGVVEDHVFEIDSDAGDAVAYKRRRDVSSRQLKL